MCRRHNPPVPTQSEPCGLAASWVAVSTARLHLVLTPAAYPSMHLPLGSSGVAIACNGSPMHLEPWVASGVFLRYAVLGLLPCAAAREWAEEHAETGRFTLSGRAGLCVSAVMTCGRVGSRSGWYGSGAMAASNQGGA